MTDTRSSETLHASCVSYADKGVLIFGASGSGKSALALQLMALGAQLVSDDQTEVVRQDDLLMAVAPAQLQGLIEARGVGILHANAIGPAQITLAVDMDTTEIQRMPALHQRSVCSVILPCLHKIDAAHFPAAIVQYLKAGRWKPD